MNEVIQANSFDSYNEYIKESGYYYIPPHICKNIIISADACGLSRSKAIKKVINAIFLKNKFNDFLPPIQHLDQKNISVYYGELAEYLVRAAHMGKGVDIAFGYPKLLVFNVC